MKYILHKIQDLTEECVAIYYHNMTHHIERIIECIEDQGYIQGIIEGEKHKVSIKEIYYFEAVDKMCFAYTKAQVYKVGHTLQELERQMKIHGFIRISKSVVVNIFQINHIKSEGNMRIKVHLENREALLVSRCYKKNFEQMLNDTYKQLGRKSLK